MNIIGENMKTNIGLVGLAVMGENLAMNMLNNGFSVSVYNRTYAKVENFVAGRANGMNVVGKETLEDFVQSIETPRKIMLMVRSGQSVDDMVDALSPHLSKGDIIIDGGNSNYEDSMRRYDTLKEKGLNFVSCGVSGGELGALHGPSMMISCDKEVYDLIEPIYTKISAKAPKDGEACVTRVGNGGSGHFVKTVHNGIEYGDMQAIAEIYTVLQKLFSFNNETIASTFLDFKKGKLDSYLIEISADIFNFKENGEYIIDKILDLAFQKGTGKWSSIAALDENVSLSLITLSVFQRFISMQKNQRVSLSSIYGENTSFDKEDLSLLDVENALYAAKLISYCQGFELLQEKSNNMNFGIDLSKVAKIWRAGCIIRSTFLDDLSESFKSLKTGENLLFSEFYQKRLKECIPSLRKLVAISLKNALPIATLSSALNYFDSMTCAYSNANLIQAQRDYFGAHTYKRIDKTFDENFHSNWTNEGGNTVSSEYNV